MSNNKKYKSCLESLDFWIKYDYEAAVYSRLFDRIGYYNQKAKTEEYFKEAVLKYNQYDLCMYILSEIENDEYVLGVASENNLKDNIQAGLFLVGNEELLVEAAQYYNKTVKEMFDGGAETADRNIRKYLVDKIIEKTIEDYFNSQVEHRMVLKGSYLSYI